MINPQAEELNKLLQQDNPLIYKLLSEQGKAIFFPKKGILAQAAEAKGKNINATIGIALEENNEPMHLSSVSEKVDLDVKDVFPYASSFGKPELRQKWQELIKSKNPSLKSNISLPVVTNALTHGLSMVGYLFVDSGDEIILADKFWGNYKLIFENGYNAKLNTFNTFKDNRFDLESFAEKLKGEGKKIILLNFPNNPTGYTPTDEEVDQIVGIIKKSPGEILVICDDAYLGLVYEDGVYKESIFAKLAELDNVLAIKVDGATKEDYVWGLRVGFLTYSCESKVLEEKTAGAIRGNISNASNLSQSLVLTTLNSPNYKKEKEEKFQILKKRYQKVKEILTDEKFKEEFTALPFNSGYFMCLEMKKDAEKIRQKLLEKYDTGVIVFGNLIRVAFSSVPLGKIEELFENIYQASKEV